MKSIGQDFLYLVSGVKAGDVKGVWDILHTSFERATNENRLNLRRSFLKLNAKSCGGLSKFIAEINR